MLGAIPMGLVRCGNLRQSSPNASEALVSGSGPQEFWHQNPIHIFCHIKVHESRCQIIGFHLKYHVPQTFLTPIPTAHPTSYSHSAGSAMEGDLGKLFMYLLINYLLNAYYVLTNLSS